MKSGIYKITNTINGRTYIGSSKDIRKRQLRHFNELRKGSHHNVFLQRSFDKHGDKCFSFEVIEYTKELLSREQYWIDNLNPDYNIGSVGGGDNITNHPRRDEIIKKSTEILLNAPRPKPLFGEDNPNWRGGKTFCSCGTRISSMSSTCTVCRDRCGINNPFYGRTHKQETKNLISEARKGKPNLSCSKRLIADGVEYRSATLAAKMLNVSVGTVVYRIKSKNFDYYYI